MKYLAHILYLFIYIGDDFELGIDVISMKFTHHHLFTKEHVVASRLQASCLEYVKREKEAIAAHLQDRVSVIAPNSSTCIPIYYYATKHKPTRLTSYSVILSLCDWLNKF